MSALVPAPQEGAAQPGRSASASGTRSGPPGDAELLRRALEHSVRATRHTVPTGTLRAFPVGEAQRGWHSGLLRSVHEQKTAIYEQAGEIEIVLQADGRLLSFCDPRKEPTSAEVRLQPAEAIRKVAELAGLSPKGADLFAETIERPDGRRLFRVASPEAEGKGSPRARISAEVNAQTGAVIRFTCEPPPPPPLPARKTAP